VAGLELRSVVDPAGDGVAGGERVRSLEQALEDAAVSAVLVVAPNDFHVPLALQAVEAGRHVLLEKPVALTLAELDPLVDAAKRNDVVVMPDHVMRYYAPLVAVKRAIDDGLLGTPLAFHVERRDLLTRTKPWLQQRARVGGMLYQSTCHEFDLLRWLGGDIVEIFSHAAPRRIAAEPLDYADLVVSQLRFASGSAGQIWSCMTDPTMHYGGVVTGDEGTLSFDLYDARIRWRRLDGEAGEQRWPPGHQWSPLAWVSTGGIGAGEAEAVRALLADFRDACLGIRDPPIALADGLAATELAQAGYRSIAERQPVRLPLEGAERSRLTYLESPLDAPIG
jgi:UDP-N-acetyl-2-amino-2-deoxyglucuronate dehydrogenase